VLYVCTPYWTGCPLSKDQSKEVYGPLLTQLPQHTYVSLFHQRAVFCMSRQHIYVDLQQYAYLPTYNNMLQIFDVTHCTSSWFLNKNKTTSCSVYCVVTWGTEEGVGFIIWNINAESNNALSLFLALGTKQFVLSLWKLLNGPLYSKLAKDCKTVASAPTAQPMACSAQKLSRAAQSCACAQKLWRAAQPDTC